MYENKLMELDNVTEGTLPARAWIPYKQAMFLDGEWDFLWSKGKPLSGAENPEKWKSLPVPANWEFHGFGKPNYLNFRYPKALSRRQIPKIKDEENEWGLYRKKFVVEAGYPCKDAILTLEGVRSTYQVWCNGIHLGYAQGSNTPKEFSLESVLREGENELRVLVMKFGVGSYLEDQDMWRLAGIFRPVVIHTICETGLYDCRIEAEPSVDWEQGTMRVTARTRKSAGDKIIVALSDFEEEMELMNVDGVFQGEMKVNAPRCWNAEDPFLYDCKLRVIENQQVVDMTVLRIGFRRVELTAEALKINGRPIMIKGVNRHEFHPEVGHAMSVEMIRKDLELLKRFNVNAIRTSHYPNRAEFYALCDELGFYVMDEANIETHGLRHKIPCNRMEWLPHCADRAVRMMRRDFNHPSVIMWSMGNEAGMGQVFHALKKRMKQEDASRPIHYEGDHKLDVSDVFSTMYSTPMEVEKIGKRQAVKVGYFEQKNLLGLKVNPDQYADKPFLLCEFGHAMMNSLGNFDEYLDAFRRYPHVLGGFIWDFSDQAIRGKQGELFYGGDFVPEDHDGFFCANGIFDANRQPHPSAYEVRHQYQNLWMDEIESGYRIINENSFTDYEEITIRAVWLDEMGNEQVAESVHSLPALSSIELPYPDWRKQGQRRIDFFMMQGEKTLATHQFGQDQSQVLRQSDRSYIDGFQVDSETGCLSSLLVQGEEQLVDPMTLNFDRVETANDWNYGNFYAFLKRESWWEKRAKQLRVTGIKRNGDEVAVEWAHPGFSGLKALYRLEAGKLQITLEGRPKRDMIRFGLSMGLDPKYSIVEWHGRGPWENYEDRKSGAFLGTYRENICDMSTPYLVPMENGNRCDCTVLRLSGNLREEIAISSLGKSFSFSAWNYRKTSLKEWTHLHQVAEEQVCTINLDAAQIGVGGEKPGLLSLHDRYQLPAGKHMILSVEMGGKNEA